MKEADIYLGEIKNQIIFAKRAYESYLNTLDEEDIPSIFYHLHHFIVHAADIDKLIDLKEGSHRYRILKDNLNLTDINIKPFRKLRNHLEHLDERLDFWVHEYYNRGCPLFDMNLITGAKGFPKEISLRALDGNTFLFYGEEFNLLDCIMQLRRSKKE